MRYNKNNYFISLFASLAIFLGTTSYVFAEVSSNLPIENAELTDAPNVPKAIQRKTPAKVIVDLEIIETIGKLADNVEYTFWTFGGKVPGKFIRVKEGDQVEFHLKNNQNNKMPHNIDLHAVTGPGGGAKVSLVPPGKQVTFSFKALNPGLYIYHCAAAPVPVHVSNGMYGLILVEPKEGLPSVDKEFYVVQGDFYTKGKFGETGYQEFDINKGIEEKPTYVVFNGATNSLVDKNSLVAKKGETVRVYFGNGGPNMMSSFHIIGEIFDLVYQEGGTIASQKNVQTTVVPPGGSAMVDFKVDVPGSFVLVDHAIYRPFHKGTIGILKVEGENETEIFSGKQKEEPFFSETKVQTEPTIKSTDPEYPEAPISKDPNTEKKNMLDFGKQVFGRTCIACHQANGQGIPSVFPPLAKSDYLMKDKNKGIDIVLKGLTGKINVNGVTYQSEMPAHNFLSDKEISSVLNYIRTSWGNKGDIISEEEVKKHRDSLKLK
ncbi:MAG: copper-containing nitrite reductase [Candidatus Sericytochromatia bacterium]